MITGIGTIVNAAAIVGGGAVGLVLKRGLKALSFTIHKKRQGLFCIMTKLKAGD